MTAMTENAASTDVTGVTEPRSGLADRQTRVDAGGTVAFAAAVAVAIPFRDERPAQILIGAVSMVLFAAGAGAALWAYVSALERSRTSEIGVANLYLLTGRTAPPLVKRLMIGMLGVQVVLAFAGAIIGATGLTGSEVNALAFGILVPMFGIGMNGLWAVRHGAFGPRIDKSVQPSNRKIG
jgi:hypothetical protein